MPLTTTPMATANAPAGDTKNGAASTVAIGSIRGFGRNQTGLFKMSNDIFGWKNKASQRVYQFKASEVERAEWVRVGNNNNQLKLYMNELSKEHTDQIVRFDGFRDEHFDMVNGNFEKYCKIKMTKAATASRGWHWGEYSWSGKNFAFAIDSKPAFDLYTPDLAHVTAPSKTDLTLEFQPDDTRDVGDDELLEIRFFVPPKQDAGDSDAQPLEDLRAKIMEKSGLVQSGQGVESVVMNQIIDVHLLVPRGRYEIDIGPTAMKFHGKSYDYTMQYKNILRMFLVPRPNSPHLAFIIALENAMRQGQTRYPFIVMQFDEKTETEMDLNLTAQQLEQYDLEKHLSGKLYDVLPRLLKALVSKPVIVPGDFRSTNDQAAVRCSCRAQDGHLYPLGRSFLYIIKPMIFIKYDDILSVEFSRTSATDTTRYFEFRVSCKGGTEYDFTSIDRSEYKVLVEFLQKKNLKIRNLQESKTGSGRSAFPGAQLPLDDDTEDEEDEEFDDEDESEDEDFDEAEDTVDESSESGEDDQGGDAEGSDPEGGVKSDKALKKKSGVESSNSEKKKRKREKEKKDKKREKKERKKEKKEKK